MWGALYFLITSFRIFAGFPLSERVCLSACKDTACSASCGVVNLRKSAPVCLICAHSISGLAFEADINIKRTVWASRPQS